MDIESMKAHIDYCPETGVMTWKKVLSNRVKVGMQCGANIDSKGYGRVCFSGKQYRAHRVAWAIHYGEDACGQIDHINGDRLDNRICNLRIATNQENSRNNCISANNTSGATGVTWHKKSGKWMAQIVVSYKPIYLGLFKNKEQAVQARKKAEQDFFGDFLRATE